MDPNGGRLVCFTILEWEFLQNRIVEGLINLSMYRTDSDATNMSDTVLRPMREEIAQDNLGENILARLAAATTVPEPGPVAASPGAPQADEIEFAGGGEETPVPVKFY